jgi:hypothetical protein
VRALTRSPPSFSQGRWKEIVALCESSFTVGESVVAMAVDTLHLLALVKLQLHDDAAKLLSTLHLPETPVLSGEQHVTRMLVMLKYAYLDMSPVEHTLLVSDTAIIH